MASMVPIELQPQFLFVCILVLRYTSRRSNLAFLARSCSAFYLYHLRKVLDSTQKRNVMVLNSVTRVLTNKQKMVWKFSIRTIVLQSRMSQYPFQVRYKRRPPTALAKTLKQCPILRRAHKKTNTAEKNRGKSPQMPSNEYGRLRKLCSGHDDKKR